MADESLTVEPSHWRVLVADADTARRAHLKQLIENAGFQVTGLEWHGFSNTFDVAVIDTSIATPGSVAAEHAVRAAESDGLRYGDRGFAVPVMFVTDSIEPLDLDSLAALSSSDWILRPHSDDEFVQRLRELVDYAERLQWQQEKAEGLRSRVRQIAARMWATNDPQRMALDLITGVRAVFEAQHACLSTFADDRVPRLSVLPDDSAVAHPDSPNNGVRRLIDRLWVSETVLAIPLIDEVPSVELLELIERMPWLGEGSWIVLPMGQGTTSFGLLAVGVDDGSRAWTGIERSLIQHLVSNLAHGLMQGHLITSQRQVVEQMKQLDRERDAMLATVNHELRTPLTSIVAYLELVRDGEGGPIPEGAAGMLAVVERNAARLRLLIEDALTLAQKQSPHSGAALPGRIDLRRTVQGVADSLWPIGAARGIEVVLATPSDERNPGQPDTELLAILVAAEESELERVFTNLVGNAVKFSPDGGLVRLEVEVHRATGSADEKGTGPEVTVTVTDSGVGIPEADVPRLFTRFFRASNATRAAVPGTGLGLAIAREIVEGYGGSISLSSTLGSGTEVVVRLPLATDDLGGSVPPSAAPVSVEQGAALPN